MTAAVGNLQLSADGRLFGWCWLPSRPAERAFVQIVVDGEVVDTFMAARFDPRLRQLGVGDGAHGFDVPRFPSLRVEEPYLIEARERSTECIVGRIRAGKAATLAVATERLSGAEELLNGLQRSLKNYVVETSPLHIGLRTLASSLRNAASKTETSSAVKCCADVNFQAAFDGRWVISMPWSNAPELTIVLLHNDITSTLRNVRQVSACLTCAAAEVMVVDGLGDPLVSVLPAAVKNLRVYGARPAQLASTLNAAVLGARSPYLVFVEELAQTDAATLAHLAAANLSCAMRGTGSEWLDYHNVELYSYISVQSRVILAAPKAALMTAGGFEESEGYLNAASNMVHRLSLLGLPITEIGRPDLLS